MAESPFMDPRFMGLATLASGLLSAAGPRPYPVSFGQAIGQSGISALQAMQQARAQQIELADASLKRQLLNEEINKFKSDALQRQIENQGLGIANLFVSGLNSADLRQFGGPDLSQNQGALPAGPIQNNPAPAITPIQPSIPVSPTELGQKPPQQDVYDQRGMVLPPTNVDSQYTPWDTLNAQADYLEANAANTRGTAGAKRLTDYAAVLRNRATRLQQQYEKSHAAPTVKMIPVGTSDGKSMEQPYQWDSKSMTWKPVPGSQPREIFSSKPIVSVEVKTGESFWKEFGKGQADFVIKQADTAQQAADAINVIHSMRRSLDSGMFTGISGNIMLQAGRVLESIGFKASSDPVANTQAYAAEAGTLVGQIIKQFGSGTGLSDADRQYAERIAAGNITMDAKALARLLDIHEKADRIIIRRFNKRIGDLKKRAGKEGIPIDLSIDEPPAYSGGNPQGDWTVRPAK